MLLSKLAHEAGEELLELRGDCKIEALSMDSRRKMTNGLFFCIPGARFDAHDFAAQALENGAVALVVTHFLPLDAPQLLVKNVRQAMSPMAAAFFGHPERELKLRASRAPRAKPPPAICSRPSWRKRAIKRA